MAYRIGAGEWRPIDLAGSAREPVMIWAKPDHRFSAWIEVGKVRLGKEAKSQLRATATCALVCAGLLGPGFTLIAVKMVRQRRRRNRGREGMKLRSGRPLECE
jgi:hypothetical protein